MKRRSKNVYKRPPKAKWQVKLSDAQARLMQPGTQDIDMNRVETLKQAIRDGSLQIDAGKIADALIKDTQDFLANNW